MPAHILDKLMGRLEQLESRERSRQETKEAKKNASRIFKQWNADMGQGLSMDDLNGSRGEYSSRIPMARQPLQYGIPTPKHMRLATPTFSGKE